MYKLWFNFILGLNFISLFLRTGGMVMYDNEFKTKGNKMNHNMYILLFFQ